MGDSFRLPSTSTVLKKLHYVHHWRILLGNFSLNFSKFGEVGSWELGVGSWEFGLAPSGQLCGVSQAFSNHSQLLTPNS